MVTLGLAGETVILTAARRLTVAVSELEGSATVVAVTVTESGLGTVVGAV